MASFSFGDLMALQLVAQLFLRIINLTEEVRALRLLEAESRRRYLRARKLLKELKVDHKRLNELEFEKDVEEWIKEE